MSKREQVVTAQETGLIAQAQAEYEAIRAQIAEHYQQRYYITHRNRTSNTLQRRLRTGAAF